MRSTHLDLDILPASLLGNLLRDTLLVHSTISPPVCRLCLPSVDLGPCDLSWVLSLKEKGLILRAEESESLTMSTARRNQDDKPSSRLGRKPYPSKGRPCSRKSRNGRHAWLCKVSIVE